MAHEPFQSWKHSPPASDKERVAADLLKQVGDAESLSPQAMARVERRLRSQDKPRASFLGDLRFATAAAGGLVVVAAIVIGVRFANTRSHPSATATLADRTLALNDVPPPPEVEPEPTHEHSSADEARKRIPSSGLLAGLQKSEQNAPPAERPQPMALDAKKASRRAAQSVGAGRVAAEEFQLPPAGSAGAARPLPAGAREAFDRAEFAAAPPPASAISTEDVGDNFPHDVASCQAALPRFSTTLARNTGDVERAFIGRARCRLLLGQRQAGLADLSNYLTRFPHGRFAASARAMLNASDEN